MPEALFQVRNGIFGASQIETSVAIPYQQILHLLGLVIILSFAVVGLTAHWTQLTVTVGYFVSFEGIGLVASTLTILALSVLYVAIAMRPYILICILIQFDCRTLS